MDAADSTAKIAAALEVKHTRMTEILRELQSVAVAFSAGVDSTLVLKVALDTLGAKNVLAVTGRSDSVAAAELAEAGRIVLDPDVEHLVLDTDEFDNPNYVANPDNRCYFCKTSLYGNMARLLSDRGIKTIVNGTNVDDLGDYRPGLDAAREHGVRSPLAEAGLTKADVRELSRRLGLATHDKPAAPCLSSRVPYGEAVTPEKLRMIEAAERFLHDELGIRECRVRHHNGLARIEVAPDNLPLLTKAGNAARIDAHFRSLGYTIVTVDLRGFRSGSLNEALPLTLLHTMG